MSYYTINIKRRNQKTQTYLSRTDCYQKKKNNKEHSFTSSKKKRKNIAMLILQRGINKDIVNDLLLKEEDETLSNKKN